MVAVVVAVAVMVLLVSVVLTVPPTVHWKQRKDYHINSSEKIFILDDKILQYTANMPCYILVKFLRV